MKLVQTVLRDVTDDDALIDQGELSIPLLGLAEAHNHLAAKQGGLVELQVTSTGRQLKAAIRRLRLKDQVTLLSLYRDQLKRSERITSQPMPLELLPPPAPPAPAPAPAQSISERLAELEAEERIKFHAWVRKAVVLAVLPIPPLLAGMMLAISWQKGAMPDSAIANGLMSTATEMLKLIFSM